MGLLVVVTSALCAGERIVLHTGDGNVEVKLNTFEAKRTVDKFLLVCKAGIFDGKRFYQVFADRMVVGGDERPIGEIEDWLTVKFEKAGSFEAGAFVLERKPAGRTVLVKFFICLVPRPELDNDYTAIGKVTKGLDVLKKISKAETTKSSIPQEPVEDFVIDYVEVKE